MVGFYFSGIFGASGFDRVWVDGALGEDPFGVELVFIEEFLLYFEECVADDFSFFFWVVDFF